MSRYNEKYAKLRADYTQQFINSCYLIENSVKANKYFCTYCDRIMSLDKKKDHEKTYQHIEMKKFSTRSSGYS